MANSFIENVNHVAGLDARYGSSANFTKTNISFRGTTADVKFSVSYYDDSVAKIFTKDVELLNAQYSDLNTMLTQLKTSVELVTGLTFSFTISDNNNAYLVSSVSIDVASSSDSIKITNINFYMSKDNIELYDINGTIYDPMLILPHLALYDDNFENSIINVSSFKDEIINTSNNTSDINTVSQNILDVNTVSNDILNVNVNAENILDINTVSLNINNVNLVGEDIDNVNYFAKIYQGKLTADPTLRKDGSPLRSGDLYFFEDTLIPENSYMKVYSGSVWVAGYTGLYNYYTKTETQTVIPKIGFDTSANINLLPGQIGWNQDEKTVDIKLNEEVTLQAGLELLVRVRNNTGVTIANGTALMITGSIGASGNLTVAPHDGLSASAHKIVGIATQDILNGEDGFSLLRGKIRGIDTTGDLVGEIWNEGDLLYVKPNDNGRLTKVEPDDGEMYMLVASVIYKHSQNGLLQVRTNGIDENKIKQWIVPRLDLKEDIANKGVANGYASLDLNAKIPLSQIPDSVLGQLEYMGVYDFSVSVPIATQKGQYWIASVSGNGYEVGDWAVWNGTSFDKVDNTDAVSSVAGRTGNVILTKSDVGLSNVDNTADANKNVLSATKWTTSRTITLAGAITGSVSIDGSGNVIINTSSGDIGTYAEFLTAYNS